jgi:hypothetical protein
VAETSNPQKVDRVVSDSKLIAWFLQRRSIFPTSGIHAGNKYGAQKKFNENSVFPKVKAEKLGSECCQ